MDLIDDPHISLLPPANAATIVVVRGSLKYYHYVCDSFDDIGWGCGYRTLQTICSWIIKQKKLNKTQKVPTITEIQSALVELGDKPPRFIGSKDWIGSVEVAYVLDYLYNVQCRIIHARNLDELKKHSEDIKQHLIQFGSPIMMGGDRDCSSKCIIGFLHNNNEETWLLILDPHFSGHSTSKKQLQLDGWVKWHHINSLNQSSFYNLCCPLMKS